MFVLLALVFEYVGRIGLEIYHVVLPLLFKLFLSLDTCTRRISIGKRIGSSANRPMVNTGIIIGSGSSVNAVASLGKGFILDIPRGSALMVSFVNCGPIRVGTTPDIAMALRRSTIVLRRTIIVNCNAIGGGSMANSIVTVSTSGVMGNVTASTSSLLINGTTNIDIVASNKTPKTKTAVHIHKNSSVSTDGSPLVIVSKIPISGARVGNVNGPLSAIRPGSVRAFAVLGSTSTATVCNSHTSGNIVVVAAGGKRSKHIGMSCDNAFSVDAGSGAISIVGTRSFHGFMVRGFNRGDLRTGTLNGASAS